MSTPEGESATADTSFSVRLAHRLVDVLSLLSGPHEGCGSPAEQPDAVAPGTPSAFWEPLSFHTVEVQSLELFVVR